MVLREVISEHAIVASSTNFANSSICHVECHFFMKNVCLEGGVVIA
jgi:hypothetical protein